MRVRVGLIAAAATLLLMPASASGAFHLMQIREVYVDVLDPEGKSYVVLQMYASGQNFVDGHKVEIYRSDGILGASGTFGSDVANGANQATILAATSASVNGVAADLELTPQPLTPPVHSGGAACFDDIDCVAWGTFSGHAQLPVAPTAAVGNSAPPMESGMALRRSIAPGCSTLLEAGDDTNDSATDFSLTTAAPRNNASPITEAPCAGGNGGGGGDGDGDGNGGGDGTPDATAPTLSLGGKPTQRLKKTTVAKVKGTCDEACGLVASGKVAIKGMKKKLKLRPARASLPAAGSKTLALKLSKKNARKLKRALKKGKKATAQVKVTATDKAGNASAPAKKRIKLKL